MNRKAGKRVLGIDPGSQLCGYGVVDVVHGKRPAYVECGVLQMPKADLPTRLCQLAADLREVVAEIQPDEVAMESIFHGQNAQSALRLGYARGVLMLVIAEAGRSIFEYPPATVKRCVAGHGRASKDEMVRMVTWQCGLRQAPPVDAADAVAVALCHAFQMGLHTWGRKEARS